MIDRPVTGDNPSLHFPSTKGHGQVVLVCEEEWGNKCSAHDRTSRPHHFLPKSVRNIHPVIHHARKRFAVQSGIELPELLPPSPHVYEVRGASGWVEPWGRVAC